MPSATARKSVQKKQDVQPSELNPRTTTFEFFGMPGAIGIMIMCYTIFYVFYTNCNEKGCPGEPGIDWLWEHPIHLPLGLQSVYHHVGLEIYAGWLAWLIALFYLLPGKWVKGTQLRNGQTLTYKINALPTLIVTAIACFTGLYYIGPEPFTFVYDQAIYILTAGYIIATLLSLLLYIFSFRPGTLLALGGNSGNVIYDFFIGRELNPRIGNFDLKFFIELRPGLMGCLALNFCSAVKQYTTYGSLTDSMIMVQFFQLWYIFDSLVNEPSVLTTMDMITDGLGWMLTFGNLVLVPFGFSLQARFLAVHPNELGLYRVLGILLLQGIGYYIFRGANIQKDRFRKNPDDPRVQHLSYITTKTGSRLITSGWWGCARHINYFGDWLMGIAWCLPCGFTSVIPYFYCFYFTTLLLHRERRDDHKCHLKYGADWRRYRRIVPWRIIPGIY